MQRYKITEYTICIKKRKKLEQLQKNKHRLEISPLADQN